MKNRLQNWYCLLAAISSCAVIGAEADLAELKASAESGSITAQFELGRMYEFGESVLQDDAEAARWYTMAAHRGLASAQCNYGMMLMSGRGVAMDPQAAVEWFHKAAVQGHPLASYNLGLSYLHGDGVVANLDKALEWIRHAAEGGEETVPDQGITAGHNYNISLMAGSYNEIQKGSPEAQNHLGSLYYNGIHLQKSLGTALRWFRKAAKQDYGPAQRNLANLYYKGEGVSRNLEKSLNLFKSAARNGDAQAQNFLGSIYVRGLEVERDIIQACQWFILSAANGDPYGIQSSEYLMARMSEEQIAQSKVLAEQIMLEAQD